MNCKGFLFLGIVTLSAWALGGCGGGTSGVSVTGGSTATLEASQNCLDCHSGGGDPVVVTAKITDEWLISNHNTATSGKLYGAGCIDCHEPRPGHPSSCSRCHNGAPSSMNITDVNNDVVKNPDEQMKCFKCHHAATLSVAHFNNLTTGSSYPAEYVTKNNLGKCRLCHNPHDVTTLLPVNRDWAASGHGNTTAAPWTEQEFKTKTSCIRCHTSTGFINFVLNNFTTPFPSTTFATAGDKSREVLSCNTCHTSYDFKNSIRKTRPFVAPYNNNNSKITFPDVAASNLCIACHAGRESMATILALSNMSGASFKNPHYMAAAGIMYMTTGFTNFTTMTTKASSTYSYAASYTMYYGSGSTPAGNVSSTHRKLGTTLINGDSHNRALFVPGQFDGLGPCVTCHMNATGRPDRGVSHTLGINAGAFNQVCGNCHGAEGTTTLTGDTFRADFLEEQSLAFQNTIALAVKLLKDRYGITFAAATNPHFFEANGTSVTNWTRRAALPCGKLNTVDAKRLMGACFNIALLSKEPGAYAHGRTFARRLLYDTIDFLDDGRIGMSTGATALASGMVDTHNVAIFTRGTSELDPATSASYAYLVGYNRTTGAWNTAPYERP